MSSIREKMDREKSLATPEEYIPHSQRCVGTTTGDHNVSRTRDSRVGEPIPPEPKSPIEQAIDYHFGIYKQREREESARKKREAEQQARQDAHERKLANEKAIQDFENVTIANTMYGLTPEVAAKVRKLMATKFAAGMDEPTVWELARDEVLEEQRQERAEFEDACGRAMNLPDWLFQKVTVEELSGMLNISLELAAKVKNGV
jgi:hypothetical protein